MSQRIAIAFLGVLLTLPVLGQDPVTVFRGRPSIKVTGSGTEQKREPVSRDAAPNVECVISKIGDNYYWATRENVQLVPVESAAFITFVAVTGAGYVRVIKPDMKEAAGLMSETESKFDYVEHMLVGLRTVTYYGVSRP